MKKYFIIVLCFFCMGCARDCTALDRDIQSGPRNYEVVMYSGGDTVFYDKFNGIVNNSKESDGCYYYKNDTLVEISGDYIMKSVD